MARGGIPESVAAFIGAHIDSVDELEVLLLLREQPGGWSAEQVARELRITESTAAARLGRLAAHGLLSTEGGSEQRFRYAPADGALDEGVRGLARAYAERRVAVIEMIFSKPDRRIQTFADAFKFRRDE